MKSSAPCEALNVKYGKSAEPLVINPSFFVRRTTPYSSLSENISISSPITSTPTAPPPTTNIDSADFILSCSKAIFVFLAYIDGVATSLIGKL